VFNEITSTAEINLFTGNDLTNITDFIETNGTVALGAPYYFDLANPPFIALGHKSNSVPGSFTITYQVIGNEYEWWRREYMAEEDQWKWEAIRWSILMFPVFLFVLIVSIVICCMKCKCCKKCCRCCRKQKVPEQEQKDKDKNKKVSPINDNADHVED